MNKLILAALGVTCLASAALAQQIAPPQTAGQIPGPAAGNVMTKEYAQTIGRLAYLWGYAMVDMYNRRAAFAHVTAQHGNVPGFNGGVVPMAPVGQIAMLTDYLIPEQTFIACPNQDVVYGVGFFALDQEPVVFQVPDFGDRFWIYALYDARTDQIARIGKQYGTRPGFYLLVGPHWKGTVPAGISAVIRSTTELGFAVPRIFKDDTAGDTEAIQPLLSQIVFYPLSRYDQKMKTVNWKSLPHFPVAAGAMTPANWVPPDKFYEHLAAVMQRVPPLPGEESLYRWIASVWQAAGRDPELKRALTATFVAADQELVGPLFRWRRNGRPVGNGWNSLLNSAAWGTDYLNRTATAKSNIFENVPRETKYFYRDCDNAGQQLLGQDLYAITFPKAQLPPVKGFWSLTVYNERHFFQPNQLNRYSLGTKSKGLRYNPDGSLTLYFGAKSPGGSKETNWVPAPEGAFSLYLRCYWPEQSVLQGDWVPPNVQNQK